VLDWLGLHENVVFAPKIHKDYLPDDDSDATLAVLPGNEEQVDTAIKPSTQLTMVGGSKPSGGTENRN
jgi:hypothetical protein